MVAEGKAANWGSKIYSIGVETVTGRLDHQVGGRNTSHQANQETEPQEILSGDTLKHAQPLPSPATGKLPPTVCTCKRPRIGQKNFYILKEDGDERWGGLPPMLSSLLKMK